MGGVYCMQTFFGFLYIFLYLQGTEESFLCSCFREGIPSNGSDQLAHVRSVARDKCMWKQGVDPDKIGL